MSQKSNFKKVDSTAIRKGNLKKVDSIAIRDNYITLRDELEPGNLSDYLYQQGIFDKDDIEEIKCCGTRKEKAIKLIDKIQFAGPDDAYEIFLAGLEKEQNHLVCCLKKSASIIASNERCPSPQEISRDKSWKSNDPVLEEFDKLNAEIDTLKIENAIQNAEIVCLKKENDRMHAELDDLSKENDRLLAELNDLKKENHILSIYKESLNNDCIKLDSEVKELKIEIENLSRSVTDGTKKNSQLEDLNVRLLQECNTLKYQYCYEDSKYRHERPNSVSLADSALRSILLFKSEIDEMLVRILKTINPNPLDIMLQEFLVFSAFWNWDHTTQYLLEIKLSPNLFATLRSDLFVLDNTTFEYQPNVYKRIISPLMAASTNASYTTLKTLLDAGADVNAKDELGDTALIYLCRDDRTELQHYNKNFFYSRVKGNANCLEELISRGANLDVKGSEGMTSLMYCARNGNSKYMHTLSLRVANTKARCNAGRTALMYATFYKDDFDAKCLQELIGDSDINATDAKGDTALMYSITNNNVGIFTAIIKNEPNVNSQNQAGINALMLAVKSKNDVFLAMLLKLNPKLNEKSQDGNTSLIMTTHLDTYMSYNFAKLLIAQKEIDLNVQNDIGETALMMAIKRERLGLVESLIAASADLNLRDNNGKTALKHARLISYPGDEMRNAIKQLVEAGAVE